MPVNPISFYGLFIGINDYKDRNSRTIPPLRGAVDDAKDFRALFHNRFGVPGDQMTLLTNETATRSAIIGSLQYLRRDRRIQRGDAIFIYYAGHGAELTAPESWHCVNGTMQAIVPYDCDTSLDSEIVEAIPDRTINALLSAIAREKGNNITVVFDCCHSASGTRNAGTRLATSDELEVTARSAEINREYPPTLDQDIWDDGTARNMRTPSMVAQTGIESHVLLAACGADKFAYESKSSAANASRRGRFSTALLKLLSSESLTNLQYDDIIERLGPIKDQHPRCEGFHKKRFLFNLKVIPSQHEYFEVRYEDSPGQPIHYIVDAGTVHKITSQSTFTLFKKSDYQAMDPSESVGTLSINTLKPCSSIANVSFNRNYDERSEIVAVLTKSGRTDGLRLFIPRKIRFFEIHRKLPLDRDDLSGITLVEQSSEADIEVRETNPWHSQAQITINPPYHPYRTSYYNNLSMHPPMTQDISRDHLEWANTLSKAVKFYRELKIIEDAPTPKFQEHIDFYFHELKEDYRDIHSALTPVEPLDNLFRNGTISLVHREDVPYGIKLVNKLDRDFYVNIFFLNNRNLSIDHWVTSGKSTSPLPDAQLRAHGSFRVGWGDAENSAKTCELDDGINFAVDYLKIYLSTNPIDLSYLTQPSPFTSGIPRGLKDYTPRSRDHIWMSEIIPIIQHRVPQSVR